jgi:hypothetical protein
VHWYVVYSVCDSKAMSNKSMKEDQRIESIKLTEHTFYSLEEYYQFQWL